MSLSYMYWRIEQRRVERALAKLERIRDFCEKRYLVSFISAQGYLEAYDTVERLRREMSVEWRERQESWL